jgi:hypothetical protein
MRELVAGRKMPSAYTARYASRGALLAGAVEQMCAVGKGKQLPARLYEPTTVQGIVTRKVVRCPSVLVTPIVPPCASTTSRQSVSPRPVLL